MQVAPAPVTKLIDEFSRLPGVGPKTASRLTFYLLRNPADRAKSLAEALNDLHEKVVFCSTCFNIAESDPCTVCSNENRDRTIICVVEEPLDVLAIERTRDFQGLYHVLHGVISPVEGVGPDKLKIDELVRRIENTDFTEIIIATNATLEGDSTALYLQRRLLPHDVKVTRLARGLPVGGDLEYTDEVTLSRALEGRQELT